MKTPKMTVKYAALAAVVMTASTLGACAQGGVGVSNEGLGNLGGAVAGGLLGSQFGGGSGKIFTSVGGALLGAWAGGAIVRNLSQADQGYYNQAAGQAYNAPNGQTITWVNPQSGAQGTITPVRTGQTSSGALCREYQQTITVGGRTERAYGTACRQADGSWQIVS